MIVGVVETLPLELTLFNANIHLVISTQADTYTCSLLLVLF